MPTYTKTVWVNKQTKLNADNLNKIEEGIAANAEAINKLSPISGLTISSVTTNDDGTVTIELS